MRTILFISTIILFNIITPPGAIAETGSESNIINSSNATALSDAASSATSTVLSDAASSATSTVLSDAVSSATSTVLSEAASSAATSESDTHATEEPGKNNWGGKLIKSPFGLGLDIQTKYVWRGMEMMTEDAAPVLFPSVNYSYKGLYVYFMGGYAINGKYAEVDAGISYTYRGFTLGVCDYYYPTVSGKKDKYFGGGKHTGHWLEGYLTYAPEKIPLWATISNFFYGNDKYLDASGKEKQAYSTYLEVGTYYDFLHHNRISLAVGAALDKSCYNNYEHDFSVCNLDLKYTYTVDFNGKWSLPLNVDFIYNPVFDKPFVNFTANFAF